MQKNDLFFKNKKLDLNFLKNISNEELLILIINNIYDKKLIDEWLANDSRAKSIIYKINIVKLIKLDIHFSDEIVNDMDFAPYILKSILKESHSLIDVRSYIHKLHEDNYFMAKKLSDELKKYYSKVIDSYNPQTGLFSSYEKYIKDGVISDDSYLFDDQITKELSTLSDEDKLKDRLKKETSLKLSEMMIDSIFEDNIYNVMINIREILRYLDSINQNIILEDQIAFYKMILNIDLIDNVEKIKLFNSLKDKNIPDLFYDDLRRLKNHSYDAIIDCLTDFRKKEELKNVELSNKHGVDIYHLNGEQFYMLVKTMDPISDNENMIFENNKSNTLIDRGCYSLISNDDVSVFAGKITYGFYKFDPNKIISIFESDCMSRGNSIDPTDNDVILNENYGTFLVNRLMTPSQIVNGLDENSQVGYSEIQIAENLKPDFIVAFNDVNDLIINESKKLNIPIVIINRRKYKNRKDFSEPATDEQLMYIDFTSSRESSLKSRR